ncbi:hypothetical protein HYT52_00260 [Candidatus Woesearchaeota archaeon]|nr:hypothetical protein [Candidatus Woesearchaeota archaeon]
MATVLDVGLLEYFSAIFPVILVFALVYAVLFKTKVIGDKPAINAIIAIVAGLLMLLSEKAIQVLNFMIPWFAVVIFFFVLMILVFKLFGLKDDSLQSALKDKAVYWALLGICFAIIGVSFANAFGQEALEAGSGDGGDFQANIFRIIQHPKILGVIVIISIAVMSIAVLTGISGTMRTKGF